MGHTHGEIREAVCFQVFEHLNLRPTEWKIPLLDTIVDQYRFYKHSGRPLTVPDENGLLIPHPMAVSIISSGVKEADFEAWKAALGTRKDKELIFRHLAGLVRSRNCYGYLCPLISGIHQRDREVILLMGVAGVEFHRVPLLVDKADIDCREVGREIARSWKRQLVATTGRFDS